METFSKTKALAILSRAAEIQRTTMTQEELADLASQSGITPEALAKAIEESGRTAKAFRAAAASVERFANRWWHWILFATPVPAGVWAGLAGVDPRVCIMGTTLGVVVTFFVAAGVEANKM